MIAAIILIVSIVVLAKSSKSGEDIYANHQLLRKRIYIVLIPLIMIMTSISFIELEPMAETVLSLVAIGLMVILTWLIIIHPRKNEIDI